MPFSLTVSGQTLPDLLSELRAALTQLDFYGATPEPSTPEPAEPGALSSTYRFEFLGVVALRQGDELMDGLIDNIHDVLRRIIQRGSPVFPRNMLDAPGRPGSFSKAHGAITRRVRTITGNPEARLFGWPALRSGMWAMSEVTFATLKAYFERNP